MLAITSQRVRVDGSDQVSLDHKSIFNLYAVKVAEKKIKQFPAYFILVELIKLENASGNLNHVSFLFRIKMTFTYR
jgi:hypothetical protein